MSSLCLCAVKPYWFLWVLDNNLECDIRRRKGGWDKSTGESFVISKWMTRVCETGLRNCMILYFLSNVERSFPAMAIYLGVEAKFNDRPFRFRDIIWAELQLAVQTNINGEFAQTTTGKPLLGNFTWLCGLCRQRLKSIKSLVARIWTKKVLGKKG